LAARARPLIITLDEMQWADAASWDALDHLLTQMERERIMICLTVRDDPSQADISRRREALGRIDGYHEVRLNRLTRDEVKRWLEAAMHKQEIGRDLLAYLYRQTEGNALFITRLDRFAPITRSTLQTAAVTGRQFEVDVVIKAEEHGPQDVKASLNEAVQSG